MSIEFKMEKLAKEIAEEFADKIVSQCMEKLRDYKEDIKPEIIDMPNKDSKEGLKTIEQ